MVEMPGMLEDLDDLRTCKDVDTAANMRSELLDYCQKSIDTLQDWKLEMGDLLTKFDFTIAKLPLPTPVRDDELALLHLCNIYWMLCIYLSSTYTYTLATEPPGTTSDETDRGRALWDGPTPDMDPTLNAHRIAHSVHLFFTKHFGAYAINVAIFPLGTALRWLMMVEPVDRISDERQLLINMFVQPFLGTYIGRFLEKLQRDEAAPGLEHLDGARGRHVRAKKWWAGEEAVRDYYVQDLGQ